MPLVRVPDRYDGSGIVEKIRMVAGVADAGGRGACLAQQVESDLASLATLRARITQPKRVMFVISFLNGKPMVAGRNTAADGIIRMAGAVNAIDAYEGYKQISDEAVIAAGPDTVLVCSADATILTPPPCSRMRRSRRRRPPRVNPSSRWTGSICSASGRAPRPPRVIWPRRSIRRSGTRCCRPSGHRRLSG